mgnify:CR=1 FL=1
MKAIAEQYPDIQFCVPTGDNANSDQVLPNYHNCLEKSIRADMYVAELQE